MLYPTAESAVVPCLLSLTVIQNWLRDRKTVWPLPVVEYQARLVDRFLDWMVLTGALQSNPLAEVRKQYLHPATAPIVRALLSPDSDSALEALRPPPRFASFLGTAMRDHTVLMRSVGHRYNTEEAGLLRFDRFLQSRPDLRTSRSGQKAQSGRARSHETRRQGG